MGLAAEISIVPHGAANIRTPSVAGMFYPSDPETLRSDVNRLLGEAGNLAATPPKAIIAPHAGFIYSGPIAASAYARVAAGRDTISRVVLLGPAHRTHVTGLAAPAATFFSTPLGDIEVDCDGIGRVLELPQVESHDAAFDGEHCLEVQLPFLQQVLDDFTIVPLLVGGATGAQVAEVLELLWGGPETLIVVSSDLSHYHPYADAKRIDAATSRAIEALDPARIGDDDACGRQPIKGLLQVARSLGLKAETIDQRTSGDTAGDRRQVVGYGAYGFTPASASP